MNNILNIYKQASSEDIKNGLTWYNDARNIAKDISLAYNISLIKVSGIIAALSINNAWNNNLKDVEKFFYCKEYNLPLDTFNYTTFKVISLGKANGIYNSKGNEKEILKILNGNKIKAFFLNIYKLDQENVTIDRHAVSIYLGKRLTKDFKYSLTNKRYRDISKEYKETAKILGLKPYELQSVTWLTWRKMINKKVV